MSKQNTYRFRTVICALSVVLAVVALIAITSLRSLTPVASAAASTNLNFQARLKTSGGAVVPDGNYNIEFKIYDVDSGGTALWTETRTGGNRVRVANGYLTVNLGSVTALSTNIPWGEELWLTMNIGGTGSPSWDGEMNPRLLMTAVPYAFKADNANTANALTDGTNTFTSDDFLKIAPGSLQGTSSSGAAVRLNQTGSGGLLQLQSNGTDMLTLNNDGDLTIAGSGTFDGAVLISGAPVSVSGGNAALMVSSTTTVNNADQSATTSVLTVSPSSAGSGTYYGVYGATVVTNDNLNSYGPSVVGVMGNSVNIGTGTIYNALGGKFGVTNVSTGTINNAIAIEAMNPSVGAGTINKAVGLLMSSLNAGSASNVYLLLGTNSIPSGNWGIYNASTYANYFAGSLHVDGQLNVGTSDTTGTLLVLDTKTDSGDPDGINGAMYYNSDAGKFRCYEDDDWVDCIGAGGGGAILDGGNEEGAAITLGTNDEYDLNFETDGVTRWSITDAGDLLPYLNDTYDIGSDTNRVRDLYLGGTTLHIGASTADEGTISYNSTTDSLIVKNATNSTTAFQIQNSAGNNLFNVDSTGAGTINLLGNNSGETSAWSTTSSMGTPVGGLGAVAANGYMYHFGGWNGSNIEDEVEYAKINADGSLGAWTATTSLLSGVADARAVYANGYIYVTGDSSDRVTYAKVNSNGTLGAWQQAPDMPANVIAVGFTSANGYLYAIGGFNGSSAQNTTYYAKINANGSLGAWNSTSTLPVARSHMAMAQANGYIYALGGSDNNWDGSGQDDVYYAKINGDGTLGSWSTANALPDERLAFSVGVSNGYIYAFGGASYNTYDVQDEVYFAKLNSNGTLGTWSTATELLPDARNAHSAVVVNGYAYLVSGDISGGGTGYTDSVIYARLGGTVNVGGNLDLVGMQGGNLAEGGTSWSGSAGGSITAGNIRAVGALEVQGSASFASSVSINGNLVATSLAIGTVDDQGTLLILDTKTTSGDPDGINGAMYYNADAGKFRCYEGGSWKDCISAGGGPSPLTLDGDGNLFTTGTGALSSNTAGYENIALGQNALYANTSGGSNFAAGHGALQDNTSGSHSIAIGWDALKNNASGFTNIALGNGSMSNSEGGQDNVAIGVETLLNNTGSGNIAIGHGALFDNTSGGNSIALGWDALKNNASGSQNIALGDGVMANSEGGSNNFAVGQNALYNNQGSNNIALGAGTLQGNTSGSNNVGLGLGALENSGTGKENIALGMWALRNINGGDGNVAIGHQAAINTTGFYNVVLGVGAAGSLTSGSNNIVIGGGQDVASATGSNQLNIAGLLTSDDYTVGGSWNGQLMVVGQNDTSQFTVRANGTQTSNILSIQNSGGTSTYFGIGGTGTANFRNGTNSTTAFQIQNSTGQNLFNVDSTNAGTITLLGNNSGETSAWQTNANNMTIAKDGAGVVAANGYIYTVGGWGPSAPTSNVQYAKLNADGSTGTWTNTTSLPAANTDTAAVVANGYIYVVGGRDSSYNALSSVLRARINPDGSLGSWITSTSMSVGLGHTAAVELNGYIYAMGGTAGGPASNAAIYTKINADGSLGAWQAATNLPNFIAESRPVVANGVIYLLGGRNSSKYDSIYYARPDKSSGNISSWTTNSIDLPQAMAAGAAGVSNGYIYYAGGDNYANDSNTSSIDDLYYAKIQSDGSVGSWTTSTHTLPYNASYSPGVVVNGYLYIAGAWNDSSVLNTVIYTRLGGTVNVGGNLDLVGTQGGSLADGGTGWSGSSGGSITAGNIRAVGALEVQGNASFNAAVAINGNLSVSSLSIGVADTTGALLILDTKTDSGDPTGVAGGMYYNSNAGKFRCYQNGAWRDCLSLWQTIQKTSDQSKTNNNTLANDNTLSFSMAANTKYSVRMRIYFTAPANPDFKYALTGPGSSTVRVERKLRAPNTTTLAIGADTTYTGSTTVTGDANSNGYLEIDVIVQTGGSSGTFAFQWAQESSNGTASTVLAGSYLEYAVQ